MSVNLVKEKFLEIPLQDIVSNRYQPRKEFIDEGLQELAASIREVGLLHPPLVRALVGGDQYEIIAGERRVLACRLLGFTHIPVILRHEVEPLQAAKAALIENMQRQDLNPVEIAKAIKALMQEFSLSQEACASQLGMKRSTIANYVRILQLSHEMQESVICEKMSMAHAKVLLSCPESAREALFQEILQKGLTVREAVVWVEDLTKKSKQKKRPDLYIQDLERRLQDHFGTKVCVSKTSLKIHYYSLDDLEGILERFHVT